MVDERRGRGRLEALTDWAGEIAAGCRKRADSVQHETPDIARGLCMIADALSGDIDRDAGLRIIELIRVLGAILHSRVALPTLDQRAHEVYAQAVALGGLARAALQRLPDDSQKEAQTVIDHWTLDA
jgi:hypothetical protein